MNSQSTIYSKQDRYCLGCISWSAVIIGALVGIGISFLLNLFAVAIGLTAFVNTTTAFQSLAVGGFVGLIIIAIASMGTAGWVAGYLGRHACAHHNVGTLYGFTTWCLALVATILLSSHVGEFISNNIVTLSNSSLAVVHASGENNKMVVSTMKNNMADHSSPVVVTPEEATRNLAWSSFIAFILFFIGALSSCIAGHCGFKGCCPKDESCM